MEKVKVLWIDDKLKGTRLDTKKTIESQHPNIKIDLREPPKELKEDKCKAYDVILIDERLGNSINGSQLGLSISFKNHIVFIISEIAQSNELKEKCFDFHTGFIEVSRLSGNQSAFASLLSDLKTLKLIESFDTKNLKLLLKLPDDVIDNVYASLPPKLKAEIPDDYVRLFFHFLLNRLFLLSGELIDSKNLSVKLGLRLDSFEKKVVSKIKYAEYQGIFHKSLPLFSEISDKLWILKKLDAKLFSERKVIESKITDRFSAVNLLFSEVTPADHANCFVCGKDGVEILARDTDNDKLVPAHYDCTTEDDSAENLFYFDEKRILIKNED